MRGTHMTDIADDIAEVFDEKDINLERRLSLFA